MTKEVAQSILTTPLRELTCEQLAEYTNSAHEWSDQFLALLPRYMELIAQSQWPTDLDADHILGRFRYAPDQPLTPSENAAFDGWLLTLFELTLCSPIVAEELDCALAFRNQPSWTGFGNDICDVIEVALPTPFDTGRFQTLWENCANREADLRLATTTVFGIGAQRFSRSRFFPGRTREQAAVWYEWFMVTDHRERLSRAFERETDPRAQELLLMAI